MSKVAQIPMMSLCVSRTYSLPKYSVSLVEVVALNASDSSTTAYVVARFGSGLVTNGYWKCRYEAEPGWETPGFNDSHWSPAQTHGKWKGADKIWWRGGEGMSGTPEECRANRTYCRYKGRQI